MPKFAVPIWVYVEADTEQKAVNIVTDLVDYIRDPMYDHAEDIYDMTVGDDICPVDDQSAEDTPNA